MAEVSQLLAALPVNFAGVAPSPAAAQEAYALATQFYAAASKLEEERGTFSGRTGARLQQ